MTVTPIRPEPSESDHQAYARAFVKSVVAEERQKLREASEADGDS